MSRIIYNNIIPFKGYVAVTLLPFIFVRSSYKGKLSTVIENHEKIHLRQQTEMLVIFFLIWYGLEYVIRWICYGFNHGKAYKNISFEREAYKNQSNLDYPRTRKHYAFLNFI
jgi:hypothetical protein